MLLAQHISFCWSLLAPFQSHFYCQTILKFLCFLYSSEIKLDPDVAYSKRQYMAMECVGHHLKINNCKRNPIVLCICPKSTAGHQSVSQRRGDALLTPCRKNNLFWLFFFHGWPWEYFLVKWEYGVRRTTKYVLTNNHYKTIYEPVRIGFLSWRWLKYICRGKTTVKVSGSRHLQRVYAGIPIFGHSSETSTE